MYRSEQPITSGDIHYVRGVSDNEDLADIFDNELVVHAPWTNLDKNSYSEFYIGMSNKNEHGNRWLRIHVDDIDDLITALLYAKELTINPDIRPHRKEK